MFNLFEDQLIADVVTRAEQSRVSYNLQTEEFRTLNADLQSYLGDIKTIDDDNRQLQEKIEDIRRRYFLTLENHLKRLPNDFREQSVILTDAHLQRYQLKSRTRRWISEREELKRRIQFLATNEKDLVKSFNLLQKQERTVRNEFVKLNEQFQRLVKYVDSEKQIHRQSIEKVDTLQVQLEQICIQRSKTEFEIQTLKEEVKLMQTTKEFLNEERDTIIATQTEANEYFLAHLNESLTRIREDFAQLNENQLQQIENDYKQMLQTLEETQSTTNTSEPITPSDYDRLQDEQQTVIRELTTLNDQNQILSERVLAMEADLYSLRDDRMQEIISKDQELEHSKIELQTLNEKLNHLAEYDRNLKFELTLYRGVLESEYRRKQISNQIPPLIRPTTLRTNKKNSITDRTTWVTTNSTNQNKFYDQQQEEILSRKTPSNDQTVISGDTLWRQLIEPFNQEQPPQRINTNVTAQDTEKSSPSLSTAVSIEDQSTSPFQVPQSSSRTSSISTGTRKTPTSSTPPILREDQSVSHHVRRLPATPPELRSLPVIPSSNQTTSSTNTTPFASELRQSSSTSPQENQTLPEVQPSSSRTSSISTGKSSELQQSPSSSIAPTVLEVQRTSSYVHQSPSTPPQEHQPSSRTSSITSKTSLDSQRSPPTETTPTVPEHTPPTSDIHQSPSTPLEEHQPSSRTSSVIPKTSSDIQKSVPTTPISPEYQPLTSDVRQSSATPSEERQTLSEVQPSTSRTSSISAGKSSDHQQSPTSSFAPTVPGESLTSYVYQSPSTPVEEHQPSSRTSSIIPKTSSDNEKSVPTTPISPEYQPLTSDVRQAPSTLPQEDQTLPEVQQPSSPTSSISVGKPFDHQQSPTSSIAPTIPEEQLTSSYVYQSPPSPLEEHQPSSRTSSIIPKTSSDNQKSVPTTPISPDNQPLTSDVRQSSTTPSEERQTLSEVQPSTSRTSSISAGKSSDHQQSPTSSFAPAVPGEPLTSYVYQSPSTPSEEHQPSSRTSSIIPKTSSDNQKSVPTTPISPEYHPLTSDVPQPPSTPPQEHQPLSRTSSITSKTAEDFPGSALTTTTSTVLEHKSPTSDVRQSPSTPLEDRQTFSEVLESPITSADVQSRTSPTPIEDYDITASTGEFGDENQFTKSFVDTDDNFQYEESISYTTDERATSEVDRNERRQSTHSNEPSSFEEFEVSFHTKPNELRSSSFALTGTSQEDRKQNLLQPDEDDKLEENETSYQMRREEDPSSSQINQTEENHSTDNVSSAIANDHNLTDLNPFLPQDTSKQSSYNTSFTDIEEVEPSTSQKLETKSEDNDDPNLAIIMQDLRSVFHEVANNEDVVEIDHDLPDQILDRLEFRDHFIRTIFDSLMRKYLVQPAIQGDRPDTLDWVEFRDILFPIITGRYTERHIRKLFDFFDTSRDGYLSLQEISELLEVLHANDTIDLAQNIIDEYDTDHDGKLSVDELIEAIKRTDDINEHALSEEMENQQWFNQSPTENQTITLEVPIINFAARMNDQFTQEITLLGRIFQKVGASSDRKLLDTTQTNLSIQLTNELMHHNLNISSDDLQIFIQLFLEKKQNTDPLIDWNEFRDIFFPILNHGYYSKNDIKSWFDIFDTNENGVITQEQILQLLRLLQVQTPEEILNKLNEITDYTDSWTLDELTFALDTVDETASHLLTNNEQISSFNINWLSTNIF